MGRIDWGLAERVAATTGGGAGDMSPLAADLPAAAAEAAEAVIAYTGLEPAVQLPVAEGVGRAAWRQVNFASFDVMLDPVMEKAGAGLGALRGPLTAGGAALIGAEVGAITGLLGRRVLGQVDVRLTEPEAPLRLLLVVPNLHAAADTLKVDEAQLVRWVTVHEVTHAVQFTGVPWLRGHLGELLGGLLETEGVKLDLGGLTRATSLDDVRAAVQEVRERSLVSLVLGPERAEMMGQVQAVMSLIEGHAEHVMDAAGAPLLPQLDQLRAALQARRQGGSGFTPWKIFERLLGLEMKMRQYEDGKRFCDTVVQQTDVATLHHAFSGPEALPTAAEIADPSVWIARVA